MLSPANRRRLAIGVAVLSLAFFAVFFWYSGQQVLRVRSIGLTTPVMGARMWLTYLAMPVGSLLMGLRTVQLLVRAARERRADGVHRIDLHD